MTVPGAMPCGAVVAVADDKSSTTVTARGEQADEQGSGFRRLLQASFEHRHFEGQLVAFELRRFQDHDGILNRIASALSTDIVAFGGSLAKLSLRFENPWAFSLVNITSETRSERFVRNV
jgi:hypothetical protein